MKNLKKIEKLIKIALWFLAASAGFGVLAAVAAEFGEFAELLAGACEAFALVLAAIGGFALLRAMWLAEAALEALRARGVAVQVCKSAWLVGFCALMLASGALALVQIFAPASEYAGLLDQAQDLLLLALWALLLYRLWRSLRVLRECEELLSD